MRTRLIIALLSVALSPAEAGGVFRCTENGKTLFLEQPTGPNCQPMDIHVAPAGTDDIARKQQELQEWNRRREEQVQQGLARDAAITSQRRNAELSALGRGEARADEGGGKRSSGSRRSGRSRHSSAQSQASDARGAAPDRIGPASTGR
jgi:hypothetical protein